VAVYVALLGRYPDSHIERKYGSSHNSWVQEQILKVDYALNHYAKPELMAELYRIDGEFKAKNINPGTTADLTVATLLTLFLDELLTS
jgi:triphosphoribosyl-dephospho-CoA synthase